VAEAHISTVLRRDFLVSVFFSFSFCWVFTALHVMQTRYSEEISVRPSVRPSVCLSVTRVFPEKNGRKICPDLYTIRKNIYPSFLRRRMVGESLSSSFSVLLLAKTITHPAARSLCDSWASCYVSTGAISCMEKPVCVFIKSYVQLYLLTEVSRQPIYRKTHIVCSFSPLSIWFRCHM